MMANDQSHDASILLLAEIRRRLLESQSNGEREDIFAWALAQGAPIAQIRDLFDAWENDPQSRRQPAAEQLTGGGEVEPSRMPQPVAESRPAASPRDVAGPQPVTPSGLPHRPE